MPRHRLARVVAKRDKSRDACSLVSRRARSRRVPTRSPIATAAPARRSRPAAGSRRPPPRLGKRKKGGWKRGDGSFLPLFSCLGSRTEGGSYPPFRGIPFCLPLLSAQQRHARRQRVGRRQPKTRREVPKAVPGKRKCRMRRPSLDLWSYPFKHNVR